MLLGWFQSFWQDAHSNQPNHVITVLRDSEHFHTLWFFYFIFFANHGQKRKHQIFTMRMPLLLLPPRDHIKYSKYEWFMSHCLSATSSPPTSRCRWQLSRVHLDDEKRATLSAEHFGETGVDKVVISDEIRCLCVEFKMICCCCLHHNEEWPHTGLGLWKGKIESVEPCKVAGFSQIHL